jgi:hypothetical protein
LSGSGRCSGCVGREPRSPTAARQPDREAERRVHNSGRSVLLPGWPGSSWSSRSNHLASCACPWTPKGATVAVHDEHRALPGDRGRKLPTIASATGSPGGTRSTQYRSCRSPMRRPRYCALHRHSAREPGELGQGEPIVQDRGQEPVGEGQDWAPAGAKGGSGGERLRRDAAEVAAALPRGPAPVGTPRRNSNSDGRSAPNDVICHATGLTCRSAHSS